MVFFILLNGARIKWHYKETALAFYIFLEVKSPGTFFHPESLLQKYQRRCAPCVCVCVLLISHGVLSALISFSHTHTHTVPHVPWNYLIFVWNLSDTFVSHCVKQYAPFLIWAFSGELCKLGSWLKTSLFLNGSTALSAQCGVALGWNFFYPGLGATFFISTESFCWTLFCRNLLLYIVTLMSWGYPPLVYMRVNCFIVCKLQLLLYAFATKRFIGTDIYPQL